MFKCLARFCPCNSLYSLLLFLSIVSCSFDYTSQKPLADKGILDLRTSNLNTLGVLECNGSWNFYWKQLYTPLDLKLKQPARNTYLTVPGVWNELESDGKSVGGLGYGTYHLRILFDKTYQELALKLQNAGTALKLYVNDSLMMTQGKVAMQRTEAKSEYCPQIIVFQTDTTVLDLVIQVSNFDYRKGGLWLPVNIGTTYNVLQVDERENMIDFFLLGTLIIIGFYHIMFYTIRPKETAPLFFGLVCLVVALRILAIGNILILKFIDLPWPWLVTIEYLTFYCGTMLFMLFAYKLFPKYVHKQILKGFTIVLAGFGLLVLLTPVSIFNQSLNTFEILTFLIILHVLYILYREVRSGEKAVWIFIIGFVVFSACFINDLLYNAGFINTAHLISIGLYIFIICQSLLLAIHFSSGFNKSEKLGKILDHTNKNLEKLVTSRTQSLVAANNELEKKHKQITDSINYALRIQVAILPKHLQVKQALPESFIFFQPRDVVSGDFYWFRERRNKIFIALIDCAGHGVPGAFMSFLAYGFLNEAIEKKRLNEASEIAKVVLEGIKDIMDDGQKHYIDHVDMGLCIIDTRSKELQFMSARRPLVYIQHKPNRKVELQTVSNRLQKKSTFRIQLQGQTNFYLFSDGYTDQFGGKKNKKFGFRSLRNLLLEIYERPMSEQHEIIKDNINSWKANEKQIDDILVIGFKC